LKEGTFIIEMTIGRAEIADTLENALLKYFNDNPFINKLKQDQVQLHSRRLELMDGELQKVDSLTEASIRWLSAQKGAPNFYNNAFNSADLLKQFSKFIDTRQEVEGWLLGKRESLQLIDGVKPTITPASSNLVSTMILCTVISFFAGCLVAGVLELFQKTS
jgi:phospholipase C